MHEFPLQCPFHSKKPLFYILKWLYLAFADSLHVFQFFRIKNDRLPLTFFFNNYGCFQNSTVLVYNTKRAYYYVCPLDLEYYFCPQFAFFNHPPSKNEI